MTNEEIISKIENFPNSDAKLLPLLNEARADEREKVIGEIEEWIDENEYPNREGFGNFEIDTDDLATKLNSLREGIV